MNPTGRTPEMTDTPDKLDLHNRLQLSCLVDGELAADEARFLLRRIEHDTELASCQERWQLVGDVLRGRAVAPAPLDFSARVQAAVAADLQAQGPVQVTRAKPRGGWRRWGGGAALAASVAAVALFMAREQLPDNSAPEPVIASAAQVATPAAPSAPAPQQGAVLNDAAGLAAAAPAVAAAVARRESAPRRGSATRTQQAARASAVARASEPQRAIAAAAPVLPAARAVHDPLQAADPFAAAGTLQARPWPRSALSQGGAFNASFPAQQGGATFYPFEPRLPAQDAEQADLPRLPSHR